jgi:hypothetical protein
VKPVVLQNECIYVGLVSLLLVRDPTGSRKASFTLEEVVLVLNRKCSKSLIALFISLIVMAIVSASALAGVQVHTQPAQTLTAAQISVSPYAYAQQPVANEFAIRTETAVNWGLSLEEGEPLWLAGVGDTTNGIPSVLGITWTPEPSWWGVSWALQLRSEAGLLTPIDPVKDNSRVVRLVQVNPVPDHQYETYFSYNQATGVVSVRVTDINDDRVIHQGAYQAKSTTAKLYAGFGATQRGSADQDFEFQLVSLAVYPKYLPIGTGWDIGTVTAENVFLPLSRFDLNESIALRLRNLHAGIPGEYNFVSEQVQGTLVLQRLKADSQAATNITYLDADNLPIGRSTLRLEYIEDGVVLLSEALSLRVGAVDVKFSDVAVDRERNKISGEVALSSNGAIQNVNMSITARISELVWNPKTLNYDEKPEGIQTLFNGVVDVADESEAPTTFDVQVSLPERVGYWQVTFSAAAEQEIDLLVWNSTQSFANYRAAVLEPGEPFTIAVLPDTQYMTNTYKTAYTRMMQWIAEQAEERNIVLTLGLGDITNNNRPEQWVTAVQGMNLLNDVMPYVLSQGNHDLIRPTGGVFDREHTLMNEYFPLSKMPWITGTAVENRVENAYALFEFQGQKLLILTLEFGPSDDALAWANEIVAQHPDYKAILITHNYTSGSGGHSSSALNYDIAQNPETSVNAGPGMWTKLVRNHSNFHMVISGHIHNNSIPKQVMWGAKGNYVFEMLIDYQSDPNGGDGYFVMFTFLPDGRIEVQSYSPYQGKNREAWGNHFYINPTLGRYEY